MSTRSSEEAARSDRRDIVVRLDTPDELFTVDTHRLLTGTGRLVTGMDELVDRFLKQKKIRRRQRIVIDLPATDGAAEMAVTIEHAVRRYCHLRIEHSRRQQAVIWRQGVRSLRLGFLLFFVGVVLSYAFTRPETPDFWRQFLGDGVFLVVAWIGLWYPLDLLLIGRQPMKRERRILAGMAVLPVLVRTRTPEPTASPPTDAMPHPRHDTQPSPPAGRNEQQMSGDGHDKATPDHA